MVSDKEVHALAEVLLGRVNAPEQEIYRASRDGLEAAALARGANAEGGEPVAWGEDIDGKIVSVRLDKSRHCTVPLYPAPQPSGTVVTDDMANAALDRSSSKDLSLLTNTEAMREIIKAALTAGKPEQSGWRPIARPLEEWHEDYGDAVWWTWQDGQWLGEPSYIGTPNDSDWPGYHTHWTPHPIFPTPPTAGGGE